MAVLPGDKMLTQWKKSLTGRRAKSAARNERNALATDNIAEVSDVQIVVCKLCLAEYRVEQMYILEHCHCSFCLEVIYGCYLSLCQCFTIVTIIHYYQPLFTDVAL